MATPAIITIEHDELSASPSVSLRNTGGNSQRVLRCAWASKGTLAAQILGGIIQPDPGSPATILADPQRNPHFTSHLAQSVEIVPFVEKSTADPAGSVSGWGTNPIVKHEWAQLTVEYGTGEFGGSNEPSNVTESLEPSGEYITLPNRGLFWKSVGTDPVSAEEAPAILLKSMEYLIGIQQLQTIPVTLINLFGTVNEDDFTSYRLGFAWEAETLLFGGMRASRTVDANGAGRWKVDIRLVYRPGGWNTFYRRPKKNESNIAARAMYLAPATGMLEGERYTPYTPASWAQIVALIQ